MINALQKFISYVQGKRLCALPAASVRVGRFAAGLLAVSVGSQIFFHQWRNGGIFFEDYGRQRQLRRLVVVIDKCSKR